MWCSGLDTGLAIQVRSKSSILGLTVHQKKVAGWYLLSGLVRSTCKVTGLQNRYEIFFQRLCAYLKAVSAAAVIITTTTIITNATTTSFSIVSGRHENLAVAGVETVKR